jgi:hypothetical protein
MPTVLKSGSPQLLEPSGPDHAYNWIALPFTQVPCFKKIRPVGAELFHADRRTSRREHKHDEADGRFSKFWNLGICTLF